MLEQSRLSADSSVTAPLLAVTVPLGKAKRLLDEVIPGHEVCGDQPSGRAETTSPLGLS